MEQHRLSLSKERTLRHGLKGTQDEKKKEFLEREEQVYLFDSDTPDLPKGYKAFSKCL